MTMTLRIDANISHQGTLPTCVCCRDRYALTQGIVCSRGHFLCSVETCLDTAVRSQLLQIRTRDDGFITCPICSDPYDMKTIASHVDKQTLDATLEAMVDKRVEQKIAELDRQYDRRIQARVAGILNRKSQHQLKAQATEKAHHIRNTILNLACPHCRTAYIDFEGCMALECQICRGSFCGFCHQKAKNSTLIHQHVLACEMNVTQPRGYYVRNNSTLKQVQKQYRIKRLAQYLSPFEKDLKDAIIQELADDLTDLGISASSLSVDLSPNGTIIESFTRNMDRVMGKGAVLVQSLLPRSPEGQILLVGCLGVLGCVSLSLVGIQYVSTPTPKTRPAATGPSPQAREQGSLKDLYWIASYLFP